MQFTDHFAERILKRMAANLSQEDTELLKQIYEPKVVFYPPFCAGNSSCVTDDGEIRYYSVINKKNVKDAGRQVFFSSKDCGLSWKMHLFDSSKMMGKAVKSPYSGRYMQLYAVCDGDSKGTYVKFSDGYDSPIKSEHKISNEVFLGIRQILPLTHKKRWLAFAEQKTSVVLYSDDDGETWHKVTPEPVGKPEIKPPHEGARWYNSCEPTAAELEDGTIMMIVRTSHDYHYVYYSYDFGATWTKPEQSIFHSTLTMPTLYKLHDQRLMFFWCNTQPLPELDHRKQLPPLSPGEIDGTWEDVFTNRDANHAAISSDNGKTWIGFREMFLNPIRNAADFRTQGGSSQILDKSVHQIEAVELPYHKIMVFFGQHACCTRIIIFDIDWLYETSRKEDFSEGLINLSAQVYLKSISGNFRSFSGHCAWNRTNGAVCAPDPDGRFEDVLFLSATNDPRLFSNRQGIVWNFPAAKTGCVKIKLRIPGKGLRISLLDRWINPVDATVRDYAAISFELLSEQLLQNEWNDLNIAWDFKKETYVVSLGTVVLYKDFLSSEDISGLSYLHVQTVADENDFAGAYIKYIEKL